MLVGRLLRWTAWVVLAILAVAAAGVVLIETPWGHERVRRILVSQSARLLAGQLEIQSLGGSVLHGTTLHGVTLVQDGQPVLAADEIRLRYSLWGFTQGSIDLQEVTLRSPVVAIVENPRGWNVGQLLKQRANAAPGHPRPVVIDHLSISDGRFHVAPKEGTSRDLAGVQFDGALSYIDDRLNLTTDRLRAKDESTGVTIHQLAGSLVLDSRQVRVERLEIRTDATHVVGFVRVLDRGPRPTVEADLTADPMSMPEIALYVPAVRTIPLVANVRVGAQGPWDAVNTTWTLASDRGNVDGRGTFDLTTRAGSATSTVDLRRFNLADFTGRPGLRTNLTGRVVFTATLPASGWTNATIQYQADASEASFQDYVASDVHAGGVYSPSGVTARGHGVAYGSPATFDLTWRSRPGTLNVTGVASHVALRRLPREWSAPQIETDLSAQYRFAMDPRGWTADATLQESTVEGARLSTGTTAHFDSRGGRWQYATDGHVAALDPDRLRQVLMHTRPDPRFKGEVESDFHLEGRGPADALPEHDANGSVVMTRSMVGGVRVERLQGSGVLRGRVLTADLNGQFQAEPLVPGQAPATTRVNGDLEAHVVWRDITARITPTSFDGTIKANIAESVAAGLAIDRGYLDASVEGGRATVTRADIEGPAVKVTAAGNVALTDQGQSELSYTIDAFDLEALGKLVSQDIAGGLHLEGRIGGTYASTTVTGTMAGHQLKRGALSALTMNGEYSVEVPDLTIARARMTSTIGGSFVQLGAYKVDRLTATAKYVASVIDASVKLEERQRTISAAAEISLASDRQELRLRQFAMDTGGTVWQLASQNAVVRYGTEIAISNLQFASGPARLTVDGALPIKRGSAASAAGLTLTTNRVPLADLDALLLGSQQLTGQLDGTATVTGSVEAPEGTADMHVTAGRAGGVPFEEFRIKAGFKDKVTTVDAQLQVDAASRMTITGTVPLEGDGLNLKAEATSIQAALLEPLTRNHLTALQGTLKFSIEATGALKGPSVRGDVSMAGVQFRFVPTGALFKNANGAVHFDGDRVSVENFVIEDDDGHALTVRGSSAGGGLGRSLDVSAQSSGIHLMRNELGELALGVDLHGTGSVLAPHIEGTVRVERGRLEVDKLLARLTKSAYAPVQKAPEPAEPQPPAEPGMFSQASMDVQIRIPDNLVLRGRDLKIASRGIGLGNVNVTAGGDLRVTKQASASSLVLGAVQIVRGNYEFQGRRFQIESGSEIRLRGEETLDPALNITGVRDIAGVTARVTVGGTLRRPEITLSSDPPLDQGDILAMIVFNQPVNELGDAEQASLAERAGLLAASAVANPLADSVAKALDLDVFEIRAPEGEDAGPTITVGRQVSERLFVGFRHEFGRDETSRVSFEYRLRRFLRLVTTIGQSSQNPNRIPQEEAYGLDLFFVIKR